MKLRKLEDFITLGHKKPGFAVLQRIELRGRQTYCVSTERCQPGRAVDTPEEHEVQEEQACERTRSSPLGQRAWGMKAALESQL